MSSREGAKFSLFLYDLDERKWKYFIHFREVQVFFLEYVLERHYQEIIVNKIFLLPISLTTKIYKMIIIFN